MMMTTSLQHRTSILIGLVLALLAQASVAQELTPARYVELDLAVRQATVEGVEARLALEGAGARPDAIHQRDDQTRQRVTRLYQHYGATPARAVAWASSNGQAIEDWLAEHPGQRAEYDRLARRLDAASSQLQSLTSATDR